MINITELREMKLRQLDAEEAKFSEYGLKWNDDDWFDFLQSEIKRAEKAKVVEMVEFLEEGVEFTKELPEHTAKAGMVILKACCSTLRSKFL